MSCVGRIVLLALEIPAGIQGSALGSSGPCPIHTTRSDLFVSGNDRQKMQNWSGLRKGLLNQLKVYI